MIIGVVCLKERQCRMIILDKKKGFTFIETIVVVAMMGLMFSGASVYFSTNSNKRAVKNTMSRLVDLIEVARNNTKVRNSPEGSDNSNFKYVELSIDSGVVKIANDLGYEYLETDLSNSGVVIPNVGSCLLCFAAGDGKLVNNLGQSKTDEVNLVLSSNGYSGSINIDVSGLVEEEL